MKKFSSRMSSVLIDGHWCKWPRLCSVHRLSLVNFLPSSTNVGHWHFFVGHFSQENIWLFPYIHTHFSLPHRQLSIFVNFSLQRLTGNRRCQLAAGCCCSSANGAVANGKMAFTTTNGQTEFPLAHHLSLFRSIHLLLTNIINFRSHFISLSIFIFIYWSTEPQVRAFQKDEKSINHINSVRVYKKLSLQVQMQLEEKCVTWTELMQSLIDTLYRLDSGPRRGA